MVEPILDFLSFTPGNEGVNPKESDSKLLKDKAEAFYAWYLSVRKPSYPSDGYKGLQYIMRMGLLSTPTDWESQEAIEKLTGLAEDLDEGRKSLGQIPYEIERIVDRLIEKNPKSKFVKQATHIEMTITSKELLEMIDTLIHEVMPNMSPIEAERVCRIIEEASSQNIKELKNCIHLLMDEDRLA